MAAAVYEDFSTAHALFCIPVTEDEEDFDQENDMQSRLHLPKYAEHKEVFSEMQLCACVLSQRAKQANVSMNAYLEAETIDCDPTPEPALSSTRRKGGKGGERGKRGKGTS